MNTRGLIVLGMNSNSYFDTVTVLDYGVDTLNTTSIPKPLMDFIGGKKRQ
jgi:hypothetical protein